MSLKKGMSRGEINSILKKGNMKIRLKNEIYEGNNQSHNWICECGEVIEKRSYSSIQRRNSIRCDKCNYKRKEEEYRKIVEEEKEYKYIRSYRSGEVTERGILVKDSPHIRIKHLECGREYDIVVSGFKNGNRCEICLQKYKNKLMKGMTREEVNEILLKRGIKLELKDLIYNGNNKSHNWGCRCGGEISGRAFSKIEERKAVLCKKCIDEKKYKEMVEKNEGYKYIKAYRKGDVTEGGIVVKDSPYMKVEHYCGRKYETTVAGFKQGKQRCTCAAEEKSIFKLYPNISEIMYANEEGVILTDNDKRFIHAKSGKKFYFKCDRCGEISGTGKVLSSIVQKGYGCDFCSDGIDIPEKFLIGLLKSLKIKFIHNKAQKWSKRKQYDFYLPEHKIIIETHGIQHYIEQPRGRSLAEEQENDRKKYELAKKKVKKYIVIDCRESTLDWLKFNCTKELKNIFDLTLVDWEKIWGYSHNTYVVRTWELVNEGKSVEEIVEKLNLTRATIIKYIRIGNLAKKCNYNNFGTRKKTICITTGEIFESLSDAGKAIGMTHKEMFRCCNSKNKQLGRGENGEVLKWMYYDEYLKCTDEEINEVSKGIYYTERAVICVTTKEKFKNSVEASKKYSMASRNIRACCYGKRKYCGISNQGIKLEWQFEK